MSTTCVGRPKKYMTDEEKKAAKNERNKKWYADNKDRIKQKTYAEKIASMTMDEYVELLKRNKEQKRRAYHEKE